MFQKFWNIYFLSYRVKDGGKENNIFSFGILYRKGRVDNDSGQGHFRGKISFSEKFVILAGIEHYTSNTSRYHANHKTNSYLKVMTF